MQAFDSKILSDVEDSIAKVQKAYAQAAKLSESNRKSTKELLKKMSKLQRNSDSTEKLRKGSKTFNRLTAGQFVLEYLKSNKGKSFTSSELAAAALADGFVYTNKTGIYSRFYQAVSELLKTKSIKQTKDNRFYV